MNKNQIEILSAMQGDHSFKMLPIGSAGREYASIAQQFLERGAYDFVEHYCFCIKAL